MRTVVLASFVFALGVFAAPAPKSSDCKISGITIPQCNVIAFLIHQIQSSMKGSNSTHSPGLDLAKNLTDAFLHHSAHNQTHLNSTAHHFYGTPFNGTHHNYTQHHGPGSRGGNKNSDGDNDGDRPSYHASQFFNSTRGPSSAPSGMNATSQSNWDSRNGGPGRGGPTSRPAESVRPTSPPPTSRPTSSSRTTTTPTFTTTTTRQTV